jgi:hypothetical protein
MILVLFFWVVGGTAVASELTPSELALEGTTVKLGES